MIIEEQEPDRVISTEEAGNIMAEVSTNALGLSFTENTIILDVKGDDIQMKFISARENPEITVQNGRSFTVVSEYLIHYRGELLEVDTDGPFKLNMAGLGLEVLRE